MAVNLSPYGGVGAQFLDNAGNVLTGGKIEIYAAGTTTPQAVYTDSTGITFHPNPIILDASGRVPSGGEIWLTDGLLYKFVLRDSNNVLIATYDNIAGINSNFVNFTNAQEIQTATAGQTVFNLTTTSYQPGTNSLSVFVDGVNQYGPGAQYAYLETDSDTVTFVNGLHVGALVKFTTSQLNSSGATDASQVSYDPPFTNSVVTTVENKLSQIVSVQDFGAVGDGVTDDSAAIQAAFNYMATVDICSLYIPSGRYRLASRVSTTFTNNASYSIYGDGAASILIGDNANGAIRMTCTTRHVYTTVMNLNFTPALANSGTGFEYTAPEGGSSGHHVLMMQNCTFFSDDPTDLTSSWYNTITATGINRPSFNNIVCWRRSTVKSDWILNINGCYKPIITDCYFNGDAIYGITNLRNGANEGFLLSNTTINGADTGVYIDQVGGLRHPEIWISDNHMNNVVANVHIKASKFIWLCRNEMYNQALTGASFQTYKLEDCNSVYILDNIYRSAGTETPNLRHVELTGCTLVRIDDNGLNSASAIAPYFVDATSSIVNIQLPNQVPAYDFANYATTDPIKLVETNSSDDIVIRTPQRLAVYSNTAAFGPAFNIERYSASPAAGDALGAIYFNGTNASGAQTAYALQRTNIIDPAVATLTSVLTTFTATNGSLTREHDIGDGIAFGAVARKGTGSVNIAGNTTKQAIYFNGSQSISFGAGSPEGAITAPVGSLYLNTSGGAGTSLYVKESGAGNTGWAGK
jgi:hypothetical protein